MTNEEKIREKIRKIEQAIANYEELESDIDNPEYVARGNGFCDSKFSEAFIQSQLERLKREKEELEAIRNMENPYK